MTCLHIYSKINPGRLRLIDVFLGTPLVTDDEGDLFMLKPCTSLVHKFVGCCFDSRRRKLYVSNSCWRASLIPGVTSNPSTRSDIPNPRLDTGAPKIPETEILTTDGMTPKTCSEPR